MAMENENIIKKVDAEMENIGESLYENDGPCFYKILVEDPNNKTCRKIPEGFKEIIGKRFPRSICLRPPSGRRFRVLVDRDGDDMVLKQGWKDFTLASDIKVNDFLIFRYDGKMHFNVQIFHPSGLERTPKPKKIELYEEAAAAAAAAASSSTNGGKRKRGRPRKYELTGSIDSAGYGQLS